MSWRAALGIVDQVVLQEWIAVDDPDVAEHLVQHAGRAAGAPFAAQLIEQLPGRSPSRRMTISRSENEV